MARRIIVVCACLSVAGMTTGLVAVPTALAPEPAVIIQRDLGHWGEREHPLLDKPSSAPSGEWWLYREPHRLAAVSRTARRDPLALLTAIAHLETAQVASISLLLPSGVSAGQLDLILAGTGLEGLGPAFVAAERDWGVNALALVAIAAHESSWGRSFFARRRHNLFGFGAYTHNPERAQVFASKAQSVDVAARHIREQYLEPTGEYHRGPSLADMGPIWAHDPEWSRKVAQVWRDLATRLVRRVAEQEHSLPAAS